MATLRDGEQEDDLPEEQEDHLPLESTEDFCDHEIQKQILVRHYRNQRCQGGASPDQNPALQEFLQDYTVDSVVHQVIDGAPSTHYGVEGGRRIWETMACAAGQQDHFNVQRISIQKNHAKVVWKAERQADENSPVRRVLVGTDWFTFDAGNHFATQTTVALHQQA